MESIREDVDDDTSRLIFADWLDDQGDPRGEFLRTQCRLANWEPDLRTRTALQQREAELLQLHRDAWLGELARYVQDAHFHRGTVRVTMTAYRFCTRTFSRMASDLFDSAWVDTLRLVNLEKYVGRVAASSALEGIPSLDLSGQGIDDDVVGAIMASPHLDALTHLDLGNNQLTDATLLRLERAMVLGRLKVLGLRNNGLSDRGVERLLEKTRGSSLRRIELQGNKLDGKTWGLYRDWLSGRAAAERFPRLVNSLGMEFVQIPPGTYMMGASPDDTQSRDDEKPLHEVTITRPFYLGVYQVTQRQYHEVMGVNPAFYNDRHRGGPDHPVENVNWFEAREFCERLSESEAEKKAGRTYRLPTEAEWEYACRAGTTTPYWYGALPRSTLFNYDGNHVYGGTPKGPYLYRTAPVGSYTPNPFGLYDMHGNVWEWCQDYHSPIYYRRRGKFIDPTGPKRGRTRVIRGGCWDCIGAYCRSSHRHGDPPDTRDNFNGFRVALDVRT